MTENITDLDRILDVAGDLANLVRTATPRTDPLSAQLALTLCQRMRGDNGAIDDAITEIEQLLPVLFSAPRYVALPDGQEGLRYQINHELLARIRLRVEALRWLRSRH